MNMKAAVMVKAHHLELQEWRIPEPKAHEVRLRVETAGVCGTDAHLLEGHFDPVFPLIAGHEVCGIIDALGHGVKGFKEGQRVVFDPNLSCKSCTMCQAGLYNHCLNHEAIGVTLPGGFAEYVIAPESVLYDAHDLAPEIAVFAEPLGCVAWGIERLKPPMASKALLFGAGGIGLLLMQALKVSGVADITVVDPEPARLDVALGLGANRVFKAHADIASELKDFNPSGFDVVTEATGVAKVVEGMIPHAKNGGKILVFGVAPEHCHIAISPYELFRRDLTILGSFALNATIPPALAWLRSGQVQVKPLITDDLALDNIAEAIDAKAHPRSNSLKAIVRP